MSKTEGYENLVIPIYLINLKERPERLAHIKNQFEDKKEFELNIVVACRHQIGAVGLWQNILGIVQTAMDKDEDVIIICEDDHEFTSFYSKQILFDNIIAGAEQGLNLLLGGIAGFGQSIKTSENRYWVDWFWGTQFTIIYKKFFQTILDEPFGDDGVADGKFSEMTSQKMVIYPFISTQKDFGYSDCTNTNQKNAGKVARLFNEANSRFKMITEVYKNYNL